MPEKCNHSWVITKWEFVYPVSLSKDALESAEAKEMVCGNCLTRRDIYHNWWTKKQKSVEHIKESFVDR